MAEVHYEHEHHEDDFQNDAHIQIEGDNASAKAGFFMALVKKCLSMLNFIFYSIYEDIFTDDMDFITKLLIIVLFASVLVEVVWMCSPRFVKNYVVYLDKKTEFHNSISGTMSFIFGVWAGITKLQETTD